MMVVVVLVVLAKPVMVAFAIMVPFVAMLKAAAITVPIAVVKESTFEARTDPVGAGIRGTSPITLVPAVMTVYGIPVAFNPDKIRTRRRRWRNNHSRRGRRSNPDANTNLGVCAVGAEQENRGKQRKPQQVFHII
jgi:hypothetical protein